MEKQKKSSTARLTASLLIPILSGFIGSLFTRPSVPTWYAGLSKPSFNPPDWIFGPVWTVLYIMMGMALYLVWRMGTHRKEVRFAIALFAVQLVLNVAWSFLFFYLHRPAAAFVEISVLWAVIACTLVVFFRVSRPAGILLVPYLLWVSFAAVLNFFLWRLNR